MAGVGLASDYFPMGLGLDCILADSPMRRCREGVMFINENAKQAPNL